METQDPGRTRHWKADPTVRKEEKTVWGANQTGSGEPVRFTPYKSLGAGFFFISNRFSLSSFVSLSFSLLSNLKP
jgi:hypothetical protein